MKYIALAGALLLMTNTACSAFVTTGSWRYKTTVTVETPEGVKSGSAVREVTVSTGDEFLPEMHPTVKVRGEAVAVDLGKRGVLFAIMRDEYSPSYAYGVVFKAFPIPGKPTGAEGMTPEGIRYYESLKAKTRLKKKNFPMFVRFRDINDPKTVERVDPENLAASFGNGVKLTGIDIEMTEDDVTMNVAERILWLHKRRHVMGYIGGESKYPFNDPTETYLNGSEFSCGYNNE